MTFAVALTIAVSFWGARDIHVPPGLTPIYETATTMPTTDGNADLMAYDYHGHVLISPAARYFQHDSPGGYCAMVVHEAGHAAGLSHTLTGIMSVPFGPYDRPTFPWACRKATRP